MKFHEIRAEFHAPDIAVAEEMICEVFFSFNLKGVVCDVPLDEPDEGFGTHTLSPPQICSVTGYLPCIKTSTNAVDQIKKQLAALSDTGIHVDVVLRSVDEKAWENAWKDYFEVTRITDRIVVKPEWREYTAGPGEIVIHLDPGMAFGTGTHPTTSMCVQMIQTFLQPGSDFLDIGTGSGILMIAARKLGARRIVGIDTDAVAVQVTGQNLLKNNIPDTCCSLCCSTLAQMPPDKFPLIAANIIAQVIVDLLPGIVEKMTSDATVILSGIIEERSPEVLAALEKNNLQVVQTLQTQEWMALAVQHRHQKAAAT